MFGKVATKLTTGLGGLDYILRGILAGDNVVWQVNSSQQYKYFVKPYIQAAARTGNELIYLRFSGHEPLVPDDMEVQKHVLEPGKGFETFINDVHQIIKSNGRGGYYLFDCLSDLADYWYSDQMLGNFFRLTCPYLFDVEALAYFSLYRNYHSIYGTNPILNTAQIFIDVFHHKEQFYVQPIKVQYRYSPTMYMLHKWQDDEFPIVNNSATISEVLTSAPRLQLSSANYELGIWNRTFLLAEELLKNCDSPQENSQEAQNLKDKLIRMAISRDERISQLLKKYLTLEEILNIGKRVIGTGLIGGKAVGMLLARAILDKSDQRWQEMLESHDSFYLGSDVFYTFLVRNGIWWERQRQKDKEDFLEGSARARQRVLLGTFPDYIENQLSDLLDYFGQSPFIVRSSSLLEDNFGNAFAGKYESVFCVNQGPRIKRLEDLQTAIKTIYASAMSEKALIYRAQRGLLDHDEQMALLIQRVSGSFYGTLFMPHIAGVGFSFNPFVWNESIDPQAGVIRLVFGLGTRAVDRSDDDYTRVVALNAPEKRPEAGAGEVRQYTQKKVDVLDLEANQLSPSDFYEIVKRVPDLPLDILASRDPAVEKQIREHKMDSTLAWVLTFEKLLTQTDFVKNMRTMLKTIHQAYDYPVDIEFTCNFINGNYKINLLQCRPLQVKGVGENPEPPARIAESDLIMKTRGAVIGQGRITGIDRFVYVTPSAYSQLPIRDRYTVARIIGQLMHVPEFSQDKTIMLLGPGRWGTTSPELGVPISFSEIDTVSVICEMVEMHENLVPDVSLGTHLFSDLVEMDILYIALFPNQTHNYLNKDFFENSPNHLSRYLPDMEKWAGVLRVVESQDSNTLLYANTLSQDAVCYFDNEQPLPETVDGLREQ
ncbi:MAG: PEP/pyruvate-binding domain-containing protein [Sedimentisphaerales bacterium]|nr:PEP/pyruvate-binding domain-containing protein [Sedimentisphaerales bacterium]